MIAIFTTAAAATAGNATVHGVQRTTTAEARALSVATTFPLGEADGMIAIFTTAAAATAGNATVLFSDGDTDELNRTWACTRGANLVRSPNGSLLAFFSGMHSCEDGSKGMALLMRSSADNGASWSSVRTLYNYSEYDVSGYVAPTVDVQRKAVLLLFNVNFTQTWLRRSTDDGSTWSPPANLTDGVGGGLALGPPGGVQLASGRLVLAAHAATNFALRSDDGGASWARGGAVDWNASGMASGGEAQLVDDPARGPDALAMFVRVGVAGDGDRSHALVFSDDAGESWGAPVETTMVTGPSCEGSIGRLPNGTLLLSAPNNGHWRYPQDRRDLTVWGVDVARNASNASAPPSLSLVGSTRIWGGPAAYSSLTRAGDFVMFEGGDAYRYQSVMVASTGLS